MEEIELLESIKFLLLCKNDCQAIRLIEKYGYWKKQEGITDMFAIDFTEWVIKETQKRVGENLYWHKGGLFKIIEVLYIFKKEKGL